MSSQDPTPAALGAADTCFWCKRAITDDREISGATVCDWSDGGDFGCEGSPLTSDGDDGGVGDHETWADVQERYERNNGITERCDRLAAALEFYADYRDYKTGRITKDNGDTARDALAAGKGTE